MPPPSPSRSAPFFDGAWVDQVVPPDVARVAHPARLPDAALVMSCLDATVLDAQSGERRVREAARRAVRAGAAALCVYPVFARAAMDELAGSRVALALVAGGFPDGLSSLESRVLEVRLAREAGAAEIDVPIRRDLAREARWRELFVELRAIREAAGECLLKVILSTPDLPDPECVVRAGRVAVMAGADFLKTSTGREGKPPTSESGAAMCFVIVEAHAKTGRRVGFKAAGGIQDLSAARAWAAIAERVLGREWLVPGLFRIGSSRLLDDPGLDINGDNRDTTDDGLGGL